MDNRSASIPAAVTLGSQPRPVASRTELLLTASILPTLLRLAAPNVLNLLAIVGMITFDGIFMGRLGADALAGVSLVFPWVMFMQHAAASGMGGGVSSAIARALGAGQRDVANALATHALVLAIALSAIATAFMLLCGQSVYRMMGGQGAVLAAGLAYSNVVFSGVITIWALNILASVVRGTGNMGLPALVIVGSVLAHILLSSALIFGWGPLPALGPAGAGWGLIISFGTGTTVLFAYLRSSTSLVKLQLRGRPLQWRLFAEILRVGMLGMLNVAITNLSVVVLTGIAGRLGQETAIGYAMGARLEYILIPLAFGFGTAIVTMVGTNCGAKQFERARRIARVGGITVALTCGAIGLFFALFPDLWMRLFSEEAEIIRSGSSYLAIVGAAYAFYGLGMALYFATQGLGHVLPTVAANGARFVFSTCAGLAAIYWLDAGPSGFFVAIAGGFVLYGALTVCALLAVKTPPAAPSSGPRVPIDTGSHIVATAGKTRPCRSCRHRIIAVLLISAIFVYGNALADFHLTSADHKPAHSAQTARPAPYSDLLEKHHRGDRHALRIRADAERHRLWVLTLEHVYVYDTKERKLIRRIGLPADWSIAGFICPPDMVLDQGGTAYVSNNVQPRLLQIGPANFQKKEHQLRLVSEKQWETGFGALAFGSNGTLFALSALAGSLFKIDLASRSAQEMVLSEPVVGACALMNSGQSHPRTELRAVSLCVGLENRSRRVDISSDLTHGHVTKESCDD